MKLFTSCMGSKSSHHSPRRVGKGDTTAECRDRVHRYSKVHQGSVNCLAPSQQKHTVITAGGDGNATIFNYSTGKVQAYMRHDGKAVTALENAPLINGVVTGCRDTNVRLWNGTTATLFPGHSLVVTAVVITPDNTRILSGSRDNCINAWDIKTGKLLYSIAESRNLITAMKLIPNENILVQTSEDKRVRLWDTRNLQLIHVYPTKHYIQTCCDVDSAGNCIVTGSNGFNGSGCEVSLWDVRSKKLLGDLRGNEQGVNCVKFLSNSSGNIVISGSKDSLVKLWDISKRECILEKRLPGMGCITDLISYPDGSVMCSTMNGCVLLTLDDRNMITETVCF